MKHSSLTRRIEALEDRTAIGTETGVRHVEVEEIDRWWAEEWEPGSPTARHGVALCPRELTLDEWADRFGSVKIDANQPNKEKPSW